jgi:hypothetical protein
MMLLGCGVAIPAFLVSSPNSWADDAWVARSPAALQPSESIAAKPISATTEVTGPALIAPTTAPQSDATAVHGTRLKWRAYHADGAETSTDSAGSVAVHLDPNLVRAQALAPADPQADPFGDNQPKPKPATPLLPPDSSTPPPTLPAPTEPSTAPSPATPKSGNSDLFPDTLGPNPTELPTPTGPAKPPKSAPRSGPRSPNEPYQPRSDFLGPNASKSPEQSCNSTNTACADEVATLMKNTVDKIGLDIVVPGKVGDDYPCECVLSPGMYEQRSWPMITYTWKASALCHKPLYFEEVQSERYGHSHGPFLDPLVSCAHFFVTIPLLPYYMGVDPPWECQYSLGYYRPGDCAPFMVDPFPISLRGAAVEAAAATGTAFVLP